ncbi:MAG: hypothetical protein QOE26_3370 [Verrucomicrobiota bacterium]
MTLVLGSSMDASAPLAGVVEGQLKVISEKGASLDGVSKDEKAPCEKCALVILSKTDRSEIAEVTTDKEGRFRVGLPAGDYILELKRSGRIRLLGAPKQFTITAEQTVHVEMDVEPSVRPM